MFTPMSQRMHCSRGRSGLCVTKMDQLDISAVLLRKQSQKFGGFS